MGRAEGRSRAGIRGLARGVGLGALALLLGVVVPRVAGAYYECPHVRVYPERGRVVPTNFQIVLERAEDAHGDGLEDPWRANLDGRSWLEAEDRLTERIPLRVLERYQPEGLQVVLRPARALRPRTVYRLVTRDPSLRRALEERPSWQSQRPAGRQAAYSWTTGDGPDTQAPIWKRAPIADGVDISTTICPSHQFAVVETMVLEESPFLIARAIIVSVKGKRTEHLQVTDGRLFFGAGACHLGQLQPGRYRVKLFARDLAGNESAAPGGMLEIEVPGRQARAPARVAAYRPTSPGPERAQVAAPLADAPPVVPPQRGGAWRAHLRRLALFIVAPFLTGFLVVSVVMRTARRRTAS